MARNRGPEIARMIPRRCTPPLRRSRVGVTDAHIWLRLAYKVVFDIQRAREDLIYQPRLSLEAGVEHYIETMDRLCLSPRVLG